MPDELLFWVMEQNDDVLLKLLNWTQSNKLEDIGQELHNVISRQAPSVNKVNSRTFNAEENE